MLCGRSRSEQRGLWESQQVKGESQGEMEKERLLSQGCVQGVCRGSLEEEGEPIVTGDVQGVCRGSLQAERRGPEVATQEPTENVKDALSSP